MSDVEVIEGEKQSAKEFIVRIAKSVSGVGKVTADALVSHFNGDWQDFLDATSKRLATIEKSVGKPLLKGQQPDDLYKELEVFPRGLSSLQEAWAFLLSREFLLAQIAMIDGLDLSNFDINPLLAKAINLDTPRKVLAFNVYQTVTRSVVTSWGDTVEKIAKFAGCVDNDEVIEGKTGSNFDLVKDFSGTKYYIQVKSGPNTMNVGMVTSLNEAIKHIEGSKTDARGILGMTYGTRSRVSKQILSNLTDSDTRIKIGREFWDFVSEKKDFHMTLFRILELSTNGVLKQSLLESIESKITSLESAWNKKYPGVSLDDSLETYL